MTDPFTVSTFTVSNELRDGARAKSGGDGRFEVGSRNNFHLLWYANASFQFHVPLGTNWVGDLVVTHPDYSVLSIGASFDAPKHDVGDLRLRPKGDARKP